MAAKQSFFLNNSLKKIHSNMHLMQLYNLVDLLLQHLQAALGELCFCCITQRVISQSQAVHACNLSTQPLRVQLPCGNAPANRSPDATRAALPALNARSQSRPARVAHV